MFLSFQVFQQKITDPRNFGCSGNARLNKSLIYLQCTSTSIYRRRRERRRRKRENKKEIRIYSIQRRGRRIECGDMRTERDKDQTLSMEAEQPPRERKKGDKDKHPGDRSDKLCGKQINRGANRFLFYVYIQPYLKVDL